MTAKQEQILQTTIELFLDLGYNATTSKKIAIQAQVSEGLIFRHFTDKKGLLKAVVKYCDESLAPLFSELQFEDNYKLALQKIIQLPHTLYSNNINGLELLFKLNHELNKDHSNSLSQLKKLLENVFTQLNYKHPKLETELLMYYLNGITGVASIKSEDYLKDIQNYVMNKYHLC